MDLVAAYKNAPPAQRARIASSICCHRGQGPAVESSRTDLHGPATRGGSAPLFRPAGREHGYEAPAALIAALAGLAAAGLSLTIALMMGEQLPTIMPGRALTTAIPVELLLVPLGVAVAWMEAGRYRVLRRGS
jgi:hypothetical protein